MVRNVSEEDNKVIGLSGNGIENGFVLRRANGELWNNTDATVLEWKGKFSNDFIIFASVLLDNGTVKYLAYSPNMHAQINDILPIALPNVASDGNWHTYTRDLQTDLARYLPGRQIVSVLDFQVRGNGELDDIKLSKRDGCDTAGSDEKQCGDSQGCGESSVDLRYKVSLDVDYALKIKGRNDANTTAVPADIATQIQQLLGVLQGNTEGCATSGAGGTSAADIVQLLDSAQEVLQLAQELLTLSENLPVNVNSQYIAAMLRLSDDIGKMADRIGEMADRILETEDKIVVVALRMLDTIDKAQDTLLQAQKNFNTMLQILAGSAGDVVNQMQALLALLPQLQAAIDAGDSTQAASLLQTIQNMLATFTQMPQNVVSNQMLTQMMTMMQQMMNQMMQGGFTVMNNGMQQFMQMMQQMFNAMLDPNSGMNPGQIAKDMMDLMAVTEQNLLQAQQNFNNLILGLAGGNGN